MNVLLLKAWLAKNTPHLAGARLREVRQIDKKSLVLQLVNEQRAEHWLLVSILEGYPTLALLTADDPLLKDESVESGFVKALRFQLSGAKLTGIQQEGFDRSVLFEFQRKDMYGRETQRTLRVELVGRASNAYLLNEKGTVISILKHVPPGRNSVRRVGTGKPLPAPPSLGKFVAQASTVQELQRELDDVPEGPESDSLFEVLTRRVAGGDVHLWEKLEPLVDRSWSTGHMYEFILRLQAGELNAELFGLESRSANEVALDNWTAARVRQETKSAPQQSEAVHDKRAIQLESQLALARRAEELERLGTEMLQRAESLGSRELEALYLKGWQAANPDWAERIELSKSAEDNAGILIEYAQRLKRARPKLEEMLSISVRDLQGGQESSTPQPAPKKPQTNQDALSRDLSRLERSGVKYLRYVTSEGIPILVGQTDRSNDELVRHYGSSRHLWLHVRDYPGSHVLLLTNGRDVPHASLEAAAVVAGYYSQGRGETELEVSYTPVKQLRRPKGGKPGQVLKLSEKVIRVNPMRFETLRDSLRVNEANRSTSP